MDQITGTTSGLTIASSVWSLSGSPLYTILVAFVAMGIAFMIFYFAWKKLHRVVR